MRAVRTSNKGNRCRMGVLVKYLAPNALHQLFKAMTTVVFSLNILPHISHLRFFYKVK